MKKNNRSKIIFVILVILCISFLVSRATYSSYEYNVDGHVVADPAGWKIHINDVLVTDEVGKVVSIDDVSWTNTHIKSGKLAPGATGNFNIHLDFEGTEVAVRYDLEILDKSVDTNKILTCTNVTGTGANLVRTGVNTYTGLINKSDLASNTTRDLVLSLEWINDDNINDLETELTDDQFLQVNFRAVQYRGEAIVPYTG